MLDHLAHFIDNSVNLPAEQNFAAILGGTPSKGARSPILWNSAFKAYELSTTMVPLDVKAENLKSLLTALNAMSSFLGGAIAFPYKEIIANLLGSRLTPEANRIGSVNCLFRKDGELWGTNTDGEAAKICLNDAAGSIQNKKILLMGIGGTGKAVAAYLVGSCKKLTLAGRRDKHTEDYASLIGAEAVSWQSLNQALQHADILINCTSIGSAAANLNNQSPVSADQIELLSSRALVFDVIYDPDCTPLMRLASKRKLTVLNGDQMNLEQAVIAFGYVMPKLNNAVKTRSAMRMARKLLNDTFSSTVQL